MNAANFLIKETTLQPLWLFIWVLCPYPTFPAPQKIWSHSLLQLKEDRSFGLGQSLPLTLLRSRSTAPSAATCSTFTSSELQIHLWLRQIPLRLFFCRIFARKNIVMRNKYHFVLGFTAYWAWSLKGFKSHHALRESCSEKEEWRVVPASCGDLGKGSSWPMERRWRGSQHWHSYTQGD